MNTKGMLDSTKYLRNRNNASMYALFCETAGGADAVRKHVVEACIAAGFRQSRAEQIADELADQLRKVHNAMLSVHYGTDGLAAIMDNINNELRHRNAETLF